MDKKRGKAALNPTKIIKMLILIAQIIAVISENKGNDAYSTVRSFAKKYDVDFETLWSYFSKYQK